MTLPNIVSLEEKAPFLKQLNNMIDDLDKKAQVEHRLLDEMEKKWLGTLATKDDQQLATNQDQNHTDNQHIEESRKNGLSNGPIENHLIPNKLDLPLTSSNISSNLTKLNNQIKNDFITHCLSFMSEDEEAMNCFQTVWTKYLQSVGDVSLLSAFFDTLPHNVKLAVIPKYQTDLIKWCKNLFHIKCEALLCTTYYSESFQRVIRLALKSNKKFSNDNNNTNKKGIIYVSSDFDPQLKDDLLVAIPDVCFTHIQTDLYREDVLNIDKLKQTIINDVDSTEEYPLMIIANVGTPFLGHIDDLAQLKAIANHHQIWLHATGDLLGSVTLLSSDDNPNICCDSLTLDLIKLFGIQNLPYLTLFVQKSSFIPSSLNRGSLTTLHSNELDTSSNTTLTSTNGSQGINNDNQQSLVQSNDSKEINYDVSATALSTAPLSFYDMILQSSSMSFISFWSLSQRCTNEHVLHHMKHSFYLTDLLIKSLYQIKEIKILNDNSSDKNNNEMNYNPTITYKCICDGYSSTIPLPISVVLFRFEPDISKIQDINDMNDNDIDSYVDLLNMWLYDKLSQQYPKINLELLKSIHFQPHRSVDNKIETNRYPSHAFRFAPLEHLLDVIEENDMKIFIDDIKKFCEILLATMAAKSRLNTAIKTSYPNLVSVPLVNWAGIGGVRYVSDVSKQEQEEINDKQEHEQLANGDNSNQQENDTSNLYSVQDMNTVNAELARKLQTNDSAFTLGVNDQELLYLRLGMVRKNDDLDVLLRKIQDAGRETEQSLKYVEVMAEKVREGIRQAEKDLQDENQQLLYQEGILRQLPIVSNLLSWWSPSPTPTTSVKGRSFDLQSGAVESTESVHRYRMQIQKTSINDQKQRMQQQADMHEEQSETLPNHNENEASSSSSASSVSSTHEKNSQQ
ncbi:unnamed protein product [Didymodactylos carnosus]|uniref:Pyridoxal-dependent decarboxylase domain-containing protein 1 n=1 Tax=Didymodactylos carnosus TaxID=1234261 RepID=A0A814KME6_9BILA|nr:unnamed protein product [Didymodactylos carnosus]CAF1052973.1 unnamed protein product [Didymodactylos carnosus]CAF3549282.1 unnamed protein product [Didymodactylos carnosus]CAF3822334.1 unnamed protein product [Didymodactylos carnosus]